jgi:5S rRNA maturation endonuclease (ribonuclease M5)
MEQQWNRVCRGKPCPVCGKSDWCMISANGAVVICPRTEEGSKKYIDGSGYLHVVDATKPIPERKDEFGLELPEHNIVLSQLASRMYEACVEEKLVDMAENLGVSTESLRLLRMGWSSSNDAFSFPMYRAGHRLIGIRLRNLQGRKWAIKGSRSGLFLPSKWPEPKKGIVICEGPTDTAAMLTLGFNAIGRPSAMGSHALIEEVVSGKSVCILSDADDVGINSSRKLAEHLSRSSCRRVAIMVPGAKDARAWLNRGISREEVSKEIKEAMSASGVYESRLTFPASTHS